MQTFFLQKGKEGVNIVVACSSSNNPLHSHFRTETYQVDYFEILFVEKGNGHLLLDQELISLKDRMVIFITPSQIRQWQVNKAEVVIHRLFFDQETLDTTFKDKLFPYRFQFFFNTNQSTHCILSLSDFKNAFDRVKNIEQEIQLSLSDSYQMSSYLLYILLVQLNRIYAAKYQISNETQEHEYAYTFKALLRKHIRVKQQVEDYAKILGVSRITLNKVVKQHFGVTVSQMIKKKLLVEIQKSLIYTSNTISDIANLLNFTEPGHMMRFFKQQTKKTPSAFRRQYQGII